MNIEGREYNLKLLFYDSKSIVCVTLEKEKMESVSQDRQSASGMQGAQMSQQFAEGEDGQRHKDKRKGVS